MAGLVVFLLSAIGWDAMMTGSRLSNFVQAIIRVKFPDSYVLEATFHPSETIQSLIDLLLKAVARPDLPFYLCE